MRAHLFCPPPLIISLETDFDVSQDRYLSIPPAQLAAAGQIVIHKNNLQLLGVTALFIASKLEEIYSPSASDFVATTDGAYTTLLMSEMEHSVLSVLNWRLLGQTPYSWLKLYVKMAVFIVRRNLY